MFLISPLFKVSPLEKLTFTFTNFFLTFSDILSQIFYYSIYNNIFAIYFPGNFSLLKSFSSAVYNCSYYFTPIFTLHLNSATTSFVFSKSFSLSQLLCSAVNSFHHTKYFTIPLTFLLFNIFSTSYSSTPSTSTGFAFSAFCPSTCSLYYTAQLTFTTR